MTNNDQIFHLPAAWAERIASIAGATPESPCRTLIGEASFFMDGEAIDLQIMQGQDGPLIEAVLVRKGKEIDRAVMRSLDSSVALGTKVCRFQFEQTHDLVHDQASEPAPAPDYLPVPVPGRRRPVG